MSDTFDSKQLRRAVVTGAFGGIGSAVCRKLCDDGFLVAAAGRNAGKRIAALREYIGGHAAERCVPVEWDLCSEAVPEAWRAFVKEHGAVHVAVAVAGILKEAPIAFHGPKLWREVVEVNLLGAVRLFRETVPRMRKGMDGRLLAVGSVAGSIGAAGRAAYSASKAALVGLIRSLAKEYGHRGVTANLVAPGLVDTVMTESMPEKKRAAMLEGVFSGRLATPDEVAFAVSFFASPQAGYITGQLLHVDGGMTLR